MKKQITLLTILLVFITGFAEAQFYGGGIYMQRGYRRPPPRQMQRNPRRQKPVDHFKPTLNLSIGYGFSQS